MNNSFNISSINIKLYTNDFLNLLINKLKTKINEKNIEYKINKIELDYNEKLKKLELFYNNKNEIEIISNKNSLEIIQKEMEIIKLLSKYTLQNKYLDYNFFIKSLYILLKLSEILRKRLGQNELNISKNKNEDNIYRCSYKFCLYKHLCNYNYNINIKKLCYQDHYVHNMVSSDLKIIIDYINNKYNNNNVILKTEEILKTINTLNYVISHMETELKNKCLYVPPNEIEIYHYIKNK
jgi:hypothetical protein